MSEEVEKLAGELLREVAAAEIILERPWENLRRLAAEIGRAASAGEEPSAEPMEKAA